MTFTNEQQRKFIEQNFLNNQITNNIIKDTTPDNMDIFIPDKKPSMYDINENTNDFKNGRIQEFKYLDDAILPSDIVLFSRDLTLNYKIHLCLFTINQELDIPFLQFMFSKNEAEYIFPSTDLNMDSFRTLNDDNSIATTHDNDMEIDNNSSNVNNDFINQCKIFFEKVTNNTDTNIQNIYRGFLEEDNDDNENMSENIYVFFDCTDITIDFEHFKSQDYIFAVVDEINQEKIYNMNINKNILALFQNNKFVTELNTLDGEPILIPKIAYICNKNDDNEYINEYYDDEYTMDIVSPQVNHNNFDDIYLFSREPLNGEYKNIKRFALFYDENNVNEKESPKTENMDVENDDNKEESPKTENMDVENDDNKEESPKTENMDVENDDNKEESPKTENMDVENDDNKEESPKTENMDVENDDTSEGTSSDNEMDESSSGTSEGTSSDDEIDESSSGTSEGTSSDDEMDESSSDTSEGTSNDDEMDESSSDTSEGTSSDDDMDESSSDTSEGTSSDDDMDESSSDTSEGTSSDNEIDESGNDDNTNKRKENIEMELEDNEVFTFNENNHKLYGTYSIETFIEL
uniref:Uncharacterized protein n=1 Tax=viral metagenome TaxID=1070528 RepID=A0A6C0J138_9ZZZZ